MQFIQSVRDGIQRHIDKNYGGSLNQFCKSHKIAQAGNPILTDYFPTISKAGRSPPFFCLPGLSAVENATALGRLFSVVSGDDFLVVCGKPLKSREHEKRLLVGEKTSCNIIPWGIEKESRAAEKAAKTWNLEGMRK